MEKRRNVERKEREKGRNGDGGKQGEERSGERANRGSGEEIKS